MAFPNPIAQLAILKILFDQYPNPIAPRQFATIASKIDPEAEKEVAYLVDKGLLKLEAIKKGGKSFPLNYHLTYRGVDYYNQEIGKYKNQ